MLVFATQVGADCVNLCDRDWLKTAISEDVQSEIGAGADVNATDNGGFTRCGFPR